MRCCRGVFNPLDLVEGQEADQSLCTSHEKTSFSVLESHSVTRSRERWGVDNINQEQLFRSGRCWKAVFETPSRLGALSVWTSVQQSDQHFLPTTWIRVQQCLNAVYLNAKPIIECLVFRWVIRNLLLKAELTKNSASCFGVHAVDCHALPVLRSIRLLQYWESTRCYGRLLICTIASSQQCLRNASILWRLAGLWIMHSCHAGYGSTARSSEGFLSWVRNVTLVDMSWCWSGCYPTHYPRTHPLARQLSYQCRIYVRANMCACLLYTSI